MTAYPAGHIQLTSSCSGMHGDGLADDETIVDELADGLSGVRVTDLGDLVRVKPYLRNCQKVELSWIY